jgi:hypothetical protein
MSNAHDPFSGMPFALLRWIKAQQEKDRKHAESMAKRNAQEDLEWVFYMAMVTSKLLQLRNHEIQLLNAFAEWHSQGKCFTPKQRSVIGQLYAKYILA